MSKLSSVLQNSDVCIIFFTYWWSKHLFTLQRLCKKHIGPYGYARVSFLLLGNQYILFL